MSDHDYRSTTETEHETVNQDDRRRTIERRSFLTAVGVGSMASIAGLVAADNHEDANGHGSLIEVASFPDRLLTGIAVSGDERIFVNFPRFPWAVPIDVSVAEVTEDGSITPYPNASWNQGQWNSKNKEWTGDVPAEQFVGVQSVHVEPEAPNTLWVLDTGNPKFEAIVEGGPKLVRIDLERDEVVDAHHFSPEITPTPNGAAYLNDVRVDVEHGVAYLTESELGALVAVDLETGEDRRIMDDWSELTTRPVIGIVMHNSLLEPVRSRHRYSSYSIYCDSHARRSSIASSPSFVIA
ncbi:major royal jelly family protein (plasmid) [Natrinema zhouii]|uniref:major royal jelly family protein n=1 Tax=Natrinema zhouii TaxID=1710539 RepID=UPI001CFFAA26|nr:major royal jelly family protein [Natrinema zhouii]UHQ98774.1 major royal jelly family protein [Natrinema zhouii]